MKVLSEVIRVYSEDGNRVLAEVLLNGYNIEKGGPLGRQGPMLSFKLVDGSLWESWNTQGAVRLSVPDGQEALVRVAALPAEEGGVGLLEFIG